MEPGDFLCATCGADAAAGRRPAQPVTAVGQATVEQTAETVIAGWRVLRPLSSTAALRDRYAVESVDKQREGVLTLYHHGAEPDPAVYEVLRHLPREHFPEIYGTGRWNERAFEVSEELSGGTLADLGIVATDVAAIRRIVYELGTALSAMEQVGLRHRDIRPGTLLVRQREPLDLMIGGFGSARLSQSDLDIVSPLEITRYTAPEVVAGGVAAASDWWSLGMVLLEQITSGACFAGVHPQAFLIHVLANGVPTPDDLPSELNLLFCGLLARDRHERWRWEQVQAWLDGKAVAAPAPLTDSPHDNRGPSVKLGGESYFSAAVYALAAAEAGNWNEARDQLVRGVLTTWAQEAGFATSTLAGLRKVARLEALDEDSRLLVALKALNPELPAVWRGEIVTPKWLLDHPVEAYVLITGLVPDILEQLGTETWLSRLKSRAEAVRTRALSLNIELDEGTLRINLLSTSRAKLAAEWDDRRKILPDSDHYGLLSLLERRTISEEDLIVILSAAIAQFRSVDAIIEEAAAMAAAHSVHHFDNAQAEVTVCWTRGEILKAVADRIEGFAQCSFPELNTWADRFRSDRRLPLAKTLVILSVPGAQWAAPQRQQYVSQLLDFFERKLVASVMRGPLVRMIIGKTTPRVDIYELGTKRAPAGSLLEHLLMRNNTPVRLDPAAFADPLSTREVRLQKLEREAQVYKRDTGIDGLFMGFPFLLARSTDGTATRIAPLLLWPVRVHHDLGTRGSATVAFDKDREEVRINPALDSIVGAEVARAWRETAEELLGRSAVRVADAMHAFGSLANVRADEVRALPGPKVTLDAGTVEIECSAVLFLVTFNGQAIGEDLRRLKAMPPGGTGLETAFRLNADRTEAPESPPLALESDRYLTVASDPSQEEVVLQARAAPGVLIEGPPGTGKSQTIVNMVADAIGCRRSLLIVCQKHAALEVVYKRLVAAGLRDRVVMINDANRDRERIIGEIREQVIELHRRPEDPAVRTRRLRQETAARIEALEGALDRQHEALHRVDDRIGITYRTLLGELIRFETLSSPLDVPSLRPLLEKLNTAQLAALEEEVAPIARYWLPARFEGSPLWQLRNFTADRATVAEFHEVFETFAKVEGTRAEVFLTRLAPFEVDDPDPHRAWLSSYGGELLDLTDAQRVLLARWLPLFRPATGTETAGMSMLEALRQLREALAACPADKFDVRLSSVVTRLEIGRLSEFRAAAAEALQPVGLLGLLNPFRALRVRKATKYLSSVGELTDHARLGALAGSAELEAMWRPLRSKLVTIHAELGLPGIESDAGEVLLATTVTTLASLTQVATIAKHLALAPCLERVEKAVGEGTREALLKLIAAYDAAFARYEARRSSKQALSSLEVWMVEAWVSSCIKAISGNEPNLDRIRPIEGALQTVSAYQAYRGRADRLGVEAQTVLANLRSKQAQLDAISPDALEGELRRILGREGRLAWKRLLEQAWPELQLERQEVETKIASLQRLDQEMRQLNARLLREDFDMAAIQSARQWDEINRLRGQRARRLREFIEQGEPLGLMKLRPVWLMNPDVASRVLPLRAAMFDGIIYDEASQMPVEYALPSLFRARVSVVSGDEKQMPPSSFFSARVESDEAGEFDGELPDDDASVEERATFEETWSRREIKDCPDLLQLGRASLPVRRLKVHYRSEYRELIGFSNAAFYAGDLSVPVRHPESTVRSAKPIEVLRVDGVYSEQTNPDEADRVVEVLAKMWEKPYKERPSVGVVTFNRKQADLIEEKLELRAENDAAFLEAYRLESERIEEGEDRAVFVKNVENVQGDERDVIVFSSTFGRNKQGAFLRLFGVLGQIGGERRLNVAVTRARRKVIMVTSLPVAEISDILTTRRPLATPRDHLQGYMEYARVVSDGQLDVARVLLERWRGTGEGTRRSVRALHEDGFSAAVEEFISSLGFDPKRSMEDDAFGLDFAIEHPSTGLFAIGIECDAPRDDLLQRARARELWRPKVMRRAIPVIHRVSSRAWYHELHDEQRRLCESIEMAMRQGAVT
jgi:primosomal replication protein N''